MTMKIVDAYELIQKQISNELAKNKRAPDSLSILPVSKGQPLAKIRELLNHLRIKASKKIQFGENYIEEIEEKNSQLADAEKNQMEWVYLGRLQGRKIKKIVKLCVEAQGVSRIQEIEQIAQAHQSENMKDPFKIKLQVNISNESSKGGFEIREISEVFDFVNTLNINRLLIVGFMGMATPLEEAGPQKVLEEFLSLKKLRDQFLPNGILSMGMSQDLEIAIQAGSNQLRLGTKIFSERQARL